MVFNKYRTILALRQNF